MKTIKGLAVACLAAFCVGSGFATGVKLEQTVKLQQGWNAVYLEVAPDESADAIFTQWPTASVGLYDPAAFTETKQYSGTESTEGTALPGYMMWYAGEPELSQVKRVVGNAVYVCYATNAWSGKILGRPVAPRITWHPTSTNTPMNFVGFALAEGATALLADYVDGLDAGSATYWKIAGIGLSSQPLMSVNGITTFTNGEVAAVSCSKATDWSGVLNVSPASGLDFSTNVSVRSLTVRNDGSKARTVEVKMQYGDGGTDAVPPAPDCLLVRDASFATNEWKSFFAEQAFTKRLAAGEKLELEIAADRTQLKTAAGFYYGGILSVRDVDGGSKFRAAMPIELTSDGGAANAKAWPKGTWLAAGELDQVSYVQRSADGSGYDNQEVKAGGKMKVRLPLYVECDGTISLLQRFIFGSDTNGVTHIYSPRTEDRFPVAIGNAKRVSSAVLPIDEPIIGVTCLTNSIINYVTNVVEEVTNVEEVVEIVSIVTNGVFGQSAQFAFTVSENSKVNPFRHVFHPSHDGLRWDFMTATPSGDDSENYMSSVKPEIFSVGNVIDFKWDESNGSKWTPEETLTGDLVWTLKGVRREADVKMTGRFVMKRISDGDIDR